MTVLRGGPAFAFDIFEDPIEIETFLDLLRIQAGLLPALLRREPPWLNEFFPM